MCGIAGIFYKQRQVAEGLPHGRVLQLLRHRGPDFQSYQAFGNCVLYHSRLEIVDTTEASNQPFVADDRRQAMVFNGEVFNYKALQKELGPLRTHGDVEVLFRLLQREGKRALDKLNGFFAFGFYDAAMQSLLLGRDRFGVKPLYYYDDDRIFAFASELRPLLALVGPQELNNSQLYTYFRLNYPAGQQTMLQNIQRLLPGQCIHVSSTGIEVATWYTAPLRENTTGLAALLDDAVKLRLQADVPVGTFLSGGVDSSIISALAKKHKPGLETFSIGFETESYFDETAYSELVAKHINSNHHVFRLKEEDFLENIDAFLNGIDEPFADSSAFNFYILSKYTRQRVKVALSGDGADELFKGYNKHKALLLSKSWSHRALAGAMTGLLGLSGGSRDGALKNRLRQLKKFRRMAGLDEVEKQKFLACISQHDDCVRLLKQPRSDYFDSLFKSSESFAGFYFENTFDIQTVLADDMLVKADRFSMQHGIEIRNPFLDYRVVEFALNLAEEEKISSSGQKLILKKEFAHLLPPEIFTRSKKGFELPLQKWLGNHLRQRVDNDWLNRDKLEAEGIFNYTEVKAVRDQAFSSYPGDAAARLWAIIVFEAWLKNTGA